MQVLCVYVANTLLVNNFNVLQKRCYHLLQLSLWHFKHLGAFEQTERRWILENLIDNIDNFLDLHISIGQLLALAPIHNLIYHLLRLHEKRNVIRCEYII